MKLCPDCSEGYDDSEKFCEADGSPLVDEATLLRASLTHVGAGHAGPSREGLLMGVIGVLAGVSFCLIAYLVFSALPRGDGPQEQVRQNTATQQSAPARPAQLASASKPEALPAAAEEEPAPEEEQEPQSSAPSPAQQGTQALPPAPRIEDGPVSTGRGKTSGSGHSQTIVQLKDGSSLEVDAAWEEKTGVWYRRSGLVTFVARERVESITERAQPAPSPPATSAP